ncbi:MAG: hypothetical protein AAF623_21570 [Planctomycetota bacterium]
MEIYHLKKLSIMALLSVAVICSTWLETNQAVVGQIFRQPEMPKQKVSYQSDSIAPPTTLNGGQSLQPIQRPVITSGIQDFGLRPGISESVPRNPAAAGTPNPGTVFNDGTPSTVFPGISSLPPGQIQGDQTDGFIPTNNGFAGNQQYGGFQSNDPVEPMEPVPAEISSLPDMKVSRDHEEILQYYPDGKLRIRRYVVQDRDGNFIKDGPWIYYGRGEKVLAAGRFVDGIMQGQWRRMHNVNEGGIFSTRPFNLYQGFFESIANFDKGKLEGSWTITDQYGRKIFEVNYENGLREGPASWWFPNQSQMRAAFFREGLLDGEITEWDESEKVIGKKNFLKGRQVIQKSSFYEGQKRHKLETFLAAKLVPSGFDNWWDAKPANYLPEGQRVQNGPATEWYSNGQIKKQVNFRDDKPVGKVLWYHPNGNKMLNGQFKDGKKEGRWTWWHPNGMKSTEGIYKGNQPTGIWREWLENGKLKKEKDLTQNVIILDDNKDPNMSPGPEEESSPIEVLPPINGQKKSDDSESLEIIPPGTEDDKGTAP